MSMKIKEWCCIAQRSDYIPKCLFSNCDNLSTHTWQDGAFGGWMCECCIPRIKNADGTPVSKMQGGVA